MEICKRGNCLGEIIQKGVDFKQIRLQQKLITYRNKDQKPEEYKRFTHC